MKLDYEINSQIELKSYLEEKNITGKLLADIKNHGDLKINGNHVTVRYMCEAGDKLEVIFPQEVRGMQMDSIPMNLNIVYEDEWLLIIDKPSGIACIPDHRYNITLANGILAYYDSIHLDSTAHFINRLDKETSGLLLVAKYRYVQHLLSNVHIHRKYLALVDGILDEDIVIDKKIGRNGLNVRRVISEDGKDALTEVKVLEKYDHQTLVECTLHTGRCHQIRVHLSSIGHPLTGDGLYGSIGDHFELRSYYISFIHPVTGQLIEFERR